MSLTDYQRAKTGALFMAATMAGAVAAGAQGEPWRALGDCLGEAYQAADDIRDVAGDPRIMGKPVGRDAALLRPARRSNWAWKARSRTSIDWSPWRRGGARMPGLPEQLRGLVRQESERLVPKTISKDMARAVV